MPIGQFTSFVAYDCAVAIGQQAGYGQHVQPSLAVIANRAAIRLSNYESVAAGTTGYRGRFDSQRTRGIRAASVDLNCEMMDTEALRLLANIALGGEGVLTNALAFGSIGVRHTEGNGCTLHDVACSSMTITFRQGETADLEFSGVCLTDWEADVSPPAIAPAVATPLLLDDLIVQWMGGEYPLSEVAITLSQTILPVAANNAFPVSFQALNDRVVSCRAVFAPTTTTYAMLKALRDDDSGDLTIESAIGNFSALIRNARVASAMFPDFEGGNVQPIETVFVGSASGPDELELEMQIGA